MSTRTKKLSAGVPIVDSSGAVTPVSIAELAKQVGAILGFGPIATVSNGDFNELDTPGFYIISGNDWQNCPKAYPSSSILHVTPKSSSSQQQILYHVNGSLLIRVKRNTGWQTWKEYSGTPTVVV